MTSIAPEYEQELPPPIGHVKIIYAGPVVPHWDFRSDFGDRQLIEDFRVRAQARLLLLPRDDPQFRRNRERINRDAVRQNLQLEWDLGYDEDELDPYGAP